MIHHTLFTNVLRITYMQKKPFASANNLKAYDDMNISVIYVIPLLYIQCIASKISMYHFKLIKIRESIILL